MRLRLYSSAGLIPLLIVLIAGCEPGAHRTPLSGQTKTALRALPADARFAGSLDVERIRTKSLTNPFTDETISLSMLEERFGDPLDELRRATGFDPTRDLEALYFAVVGNETDAVVDLVAVVSPDRDRFEAFLNDQLPEKIDRTAYEGVTIYRVRGRKTNVYFALSGDELILASTRDTRVQSMIDRVSGRGASMLDDAETLEMIERVNGGDAWVLADHIDASAWTTRNGDNDVASQALKLGRAVDRVAVSVRVESERVEGSMILVPQERVSADDLADLTRGIIGVFKAQVGREQAALLDRIDVGDVDDLVQITATIDADMLKDLAANRPVQ